MRQRVGLVYPFRNLDSVPSLCNAAEMLAGAGYHVDIFTRVGPDFVPPSFDHEAIEILLSRPRHERAGLHRYIPVQLHHAFCVWNRHRQIPYRCFIGVDPRGLAHADYLSRLVRVPLVYFSLELLFADEARTEERRRLKGTEVALSRRAAFVIVQDRERARLLEEHNGVAPDKCVLVPNSPIGPGRRKPSGYWHRRFGLAPDTRVVLHAGSLWDFTCIREIISSARSWPENYVLVVHTRSDAALTGELRRIKGCIHGGRVFVSPKAVARQEYDALVDGGDIGIAFYIPTYDSTLTGRNLERIGLSSGKTAYYLRSGLPVIVNEGTSVSRLVQAEGCGVCVGGAYEIGSAIAEVAGRYEDMSHRACKAFATHLDFARAFGVVLDRLESLNSRSR